jgi:hypothetical protein
MKRSFYPEVVITEQEVGKHKFMRLETTLRKEHNGRWFLWDFVREFTVPLVENDPNNWKVDALNLFHTDVYRAIVLGEISETFTDSWGELVFKEDPSQISERDRILKTLKYK